MQLGFYFDSNKCTGCMSCVIACKDKNNLKVGQNFRTVTTNESGTFPNVKLNFVSMACNNCESAPCMKHCPVGAIEKEDKKGTVQINDEKCIACKICIESCPFSAPSLNKDTNKVEKCNFCLDLLKEGKNPYCVDACICRAIDFGEISDLEKKYGKSDNIGMLYNLKDSIPHLVMKIKK